MIRLFTNDTELELPSTVVVALSKRVANIGDFKTRGASFTNKFSIPLSSRNRKALGLEQYNTSNRSVYKDLPVTLVSDGIELTANSRLVINQASDVAEVELKVLNGNIFDLLKKTKLRDVDLTDYDHRWNQASVVASKANNNEDAFVYAISQLGIQSTQTQVAQCKGLIPHVFVKFLLERCANRFGYTMTGSGFTDLITENTVIPIQRLANSPKLLAEYTGTGGANSVNWDGSSLNAITIQGINGWTVGTIDFGPSDPWDVTNDAQGNTWGGMPIVGYEMLLKGTYTVRLDWTFTLKNSVGSIVGGVGLLRRNGGTLYGGLQSYTIVSLQQQVTEGTFTGSTIVTVTQDFINDNFAHNNAYLYVGAFIATAGLIDYDVQATILSVDAPETSFNRPITLAPNLPNWDMGKLFKEVANFTGSTYDIDEYSRQIIMNKIVDIDGNKINPVDWSDKLAAVPAPVRRFALSGYGKTTSLEYKESNLYRFDLAVDNNQLADTAELVSSEFTATEQASVLLIDNVASYLNWDGNLDNTGRAKLDDKPRLLLVRLVTGISFSSPNQATSAASGFQTLAYVSDGEHLSLAWPDIWADYYEPVISGIVPDIKVLTAQFLLNVMDIHTLDFSRPIYLKQYGELYYVNEVKEFTSKNELTEVELVRIG